MSHVLENPVYQALLSGDSHLACGNANVRFFEESVSPFVGFDEGYQKGFEELYDTLRPERYILYAIPREISIPAGWQLAAMAEGLQFIFKGGELQLPTGFQPVRLQQEHIGQMLHLTALTKPGPFNANTPAFGHYYGIFDNGQLVAMTGQRLHVHAFTEISAVCTHPEHLGKGYAFALVRHQVALIKEQGKIPFLHVRKDNTRAVSLYQRMGFELERPMNFYFLKSKKPIAKTDK